MRTATVIAALLAAACTTFTLVHPDGRVVRTSGQLTAALRRGGTIVLADGSYDSLRPFRAHGGTSLVAQHAGRAVLRAGLSVAGPNVSVDGLAFSVSEPGKAQDGAAIEIWGGAGSRLENIRVDGHRRIRDGIDVRTPAGFTGRHLDVRDVTNDGIVVDTYPQRVPLSPVPVLEDVDVAGVSHAVPRSSHGTGEACLWLGVQVKLHRAKLRNCAWDGLWTGFNSVDSTYDDVDVDRTPGRRSTSSTSRPRSTFSNLHVGPQVRTGVTCEWADPAYGRRPACVGDAIRDSVIEQLSGRRLSSTKARDRRRSSTRCSRARAPRRSSTSAAVATATPATSTRQASFPSRTIIPSGVLLSVSRRASASSPSAAIAAANPTLRTSGLCASLAST